MPKITIHTSLKGKGITVERLVVPKQGEYISTLNGDIYEVEMVLHVVETEGILVLATNKKMNIKELKNLTKKQL